MVSQKPKYCKNFKINSHWRKLSLIMVSERYCNVSPKPEFFLFSLFYIFIHISANMRLFGLKFSQMILHTETNKLMYNWSFLFVVLHKPTLLPSTFKRMKTKITENIICYSAKEFWILEKQVASLGQVLHFVVFLSCQNKIENRVSHLHTRSWHQNTQTSMS